MKFQTKIWLPIVMLLSGYVAAAEVTVQNIGGEGVLGREAMALMISNSCPEMPEARSAAVSSALKAAVAHPLQLPPWRLIQLMMVEGDASLSENPFAQKFCSEIIAKR